MFTLVPSQFFNPAEERNTLAEVAELGENDVVTHVEIPQYDAVLIYTVEGDSSVYVPEIYRILEALPSCPEYNKIVCSIIDDRLYLGMAQGNSLILANSYCVKDFTTAEYYIFLAMKTFQLNPEVSVICWRSKLGAEDEMSLYRYFKSVEQL